MPGSVHTSCVQPGGVGESKNAGGHERHRQQRDRRLTGHALGNAGAPGDGRAGYGRADQPDPGRGRPRDHVGGQVGDEQHHHHANDRRVARPDQPRAVPKRGVGKGRADGRHPEADGHGGHHAGPGRNRGIQTHRINRRATGDIARRGSGGAGVPAWLGRTALVAKRSRGHPRQPRSGDPSRTRRARGLQPDSPWDWLPSWRVYSALAGCVGRIVEPGTRGDAPWLPLRRACQHREEGNADGRNADRDERAGLRRAPDVSSPEPRLATRQPTPGGSTARRTTCGTCARVRTPPAPTARPNASSSSCCTAEPMPSPTRRAPTARAPSPAGCGGITVVAPTARWAASRPSAVSHTSVVSTPRASLGMCQSFKSSGDCRGSASSSPKASAEAYVRGSRVRVVQG